MLLAIENEARVVINHTIAPYHTKTPWLMYQYTYAMGFCQFTDFGNVFRNILRVSVHRFQLVGLQIS